MTCPCSATNEKDFSLFDRLFQNHMTVTHLRRQWWVSLASGCARKGQTAPELPHFGRRSVLRRHAKSQFLRQPQMFRALRGTQPFDSRLTPTLASTLSSSTSLTYAGPG